MNIRRHSALITAAGILLYMQASVALAQEESAWGPHDDAPTSSSWGADCDEDFDDSGWEPSEESEGGVWGRVLRDSEDQAATSWGATSRSEFDDEEGWDAHRDDARGGSWGAGWGRDDEAPRLERSGQAGDSDVVSELDSRAAQVLGSFTLPEKVEVSIEQCGEEDAFYDDRTNRIVVCDELIEGFEERFGDAGEKLSVARDAALSSASFVVYHEIAHALIFNLKLPVTGREEDSADQLATLLMLEHHGEEAALDAAMAFALEEGSDEQVAWDDHAFDEQRYYNMLCWVYGSDPERFAELVEEDVLPAERAELCGADYERMSRAWSTLLAPHS